MKKIGSCALLLILFSQNYLLKINQGNDNIVTVTKKMRLDTFNGERDEQDNTTFLRDYGQLAKYSRAIYFDDLLGKAITKVTNLQIKYRFSTNVREIEKQGDLDLKFILRRTSETIKQKSHLYFGFHGRSSGTGAQASVGCDFGNGSESEENHHINMPFFQSNFEVNFFFTYEYV